ncbi:helix-hairpin-helix domain-containing protein [Polyangium jinanense]|uniref:DNA polymerase beta n=1 Tax=Polyangium jinanense TaxID=2829994 RepID=A0A9X3XH61_9BACT|nr:helix-hairpin-helix domain-containing protein [Polyangium jinanense]MDC3961243.1 DNA polymerase III [Polyangium jinanense]MDC3988978.1 DNA polymerase III [Polyangium jinanense]
MDNETIGSTLDQVADLLEIEGASVFRVRAYRGAARTVSALASPVSTLPDKGPGSLEELPGIGKDLAGKIRELAETGELALLHELKSRTPESLIHLLELPGLGPKRAKAIHEGLGIDTIEELEKAAREGRLRALKGVGPKLEAQILEGIAARAARGKRISLAEAEAQVEPIVARLREVVGVSQIEVAGSYRRRRDNVGDVDILVAADASVAIGKKLISDPATDKVLADGDTKTSVLLKSGLQVDLRVVPASSFGAAMHYFTGSKAHNIAIRTLGVRRKLKISEWGVFQEDKRLSGEREEDVFASVGLAWVPPELREDRGEIDAAREGKLPKLVERADLRGDFVGGNLDADGIAAIASACAAKGAAWLVVLGATRHDVERAQKHAGKVKLFAGAVVPIGADGSIGTSEDVDVVIGEIHAADLDEKSLTQALVAAAKSGRIHVLARPSNGGKPKQFDVEAVAKVCREHGVLLGLDARPAFLAGADGYARAVKDTGARIAITSRAANADEAAHIRFGFDQARRGWCEAKDVANTLSAEAFETLLARR